VIACEFCDLHHQHPLLLAGEKALCSRCGGVLERVAQSPIEGTLAFALTAAILLVLANVLPFLQLTIEGQVQESTISSGVIGLWTGGQRALAGLILFTTILAPGLRILGLLYVLLPLSLGRVPPALARVLRSQEGLIAWAMLDVYMLALLVTLVKLAQMGSLQLETGAYCFGALFLALTLVGVYYDRKALWDRVEELR
jgi:paraquat-inducible protein A